MTECSYYSCCKLERVAAALTINQAPQATIDVFGRRARRDLFAWSRCVAMLPLGRSSRALTSQYPRDRDLSFGDVVLAELQHPSLFSGIVRVLGLPHLADEQARPEYKGEFIPSPIDGKIVLYYPTHKKAWKSRRATAVIVSMVTVVVSCIAAVYAFRQEQQKSHMEGGARGKSQRRLRGEAKTELEETEREGTGKHQWGRAVLMWCAPQANTELVRRCARGRSAPSSRLMLASSSG